MQLSVKGAATTQRTLPGGNAQHYRLGFHVLDEITALFSTLHAFESEALIRFYLLHEGERRTCDEMGLDPEDFRMLKRTAVARLGRCVLGDNGWQRGI